MSTLYLMSVYKHCRIIVQQLNYCIIILLLIIPVHSVVSVSTLKHHIIIGFYLIPFFVITCIHPVASAANAGSRSNLIVYHFIEIYCRSTIANIHCQIQTLMMMLFGWRFSCCKCTKQCANTSGEGVNY